MVCIASGPSLTAADCELVHAAGHPAVAVNTSFRLALWADVIFAHDQRWWAAYGAEVEKTFKGRKMSVHTKNVESLYNCGWFPQAANSGACAVYVAIAAKAAKVVLIGYDCQRRGQQTHWHGDHPGRMSNGASIRAWPKQFEAVATAAKRAEVRVVNASRETALTCFPLVALEAAL